MDLNKYRKQYYETTFGQEDQVLLAIREKSQQEGVGHMQLNRGDASILQVLTQLSQTKKAVEVGGLYGYSTLHIARGLPDSGRLFSLDIDEKRQKISQSLIQGDSSFSKIKWVTGDAHQTLRTLEDQAPFDMLFIDADKAGYGDYLQWAEKNLKVGGLLIADNTFLFHTLYAQGDELVKLRKEHGVSVQAEKVLKEFNQTTSKSSRWKGAMIPTEDGLGVSIKIA